MDCSEMLSGGENFAVFPSITNAIYIICQQHITLTHANSEVPMCSHPSSVNFEFVIINFEY